MSKDRAIIFQILLAAAAAAGRTITRRMDGDNIVDMFEAVITQVTQIYHHGVKRFGDFESRLHFITLSNTTDVGIGVSSRKRLVEEMLW